MSDEPLDKEDHDSLESIRDGLAGDRLRESQDRVETLEAALSLTPGEVLKAGSTVTVSQEHRTGGTT